MMSCDLLKCPRCDSSHPHLHPAVQFEGEVQPCPHDFHRQVTSQNTPERIAEVDRFPRIYVASSWRCARQPEVVWALREDGYDVYDFRAPKGPGSSGFSWHQLDPSIPPGPADLKLPATQIRAMLEHPIADDGFAADMQALRECDICVLVLPCGRSAHLEAGWAAGAGKFVVVLLEDGEPDLMWKMADRLCTTVDGVRDVLGDEWRAAA